MHNTVLMILSVRNSKSFEESVNKLQCEKIWFKGYREHELAPIVNDFVQNSNFENYFIAPDDLIIKPHQFEKLKSALNYNDIVTGWGVIRQNCTHTTITKPHNFLQTNIFKHQFTTHFLKNQQYNLSYKTHEINSLPNEIETAFTGWFYTGMKKHIWTQYPYECLNPPFASSDLMFSRRVLLDKKYKQICVKSANVIHISNSNSLSTDTSFFDMSTCFSNKSIIKTF